MGDVNYDIRKGFKPNAIKRYEEVNKLYSMQQINSSLYTDGSIVCDDTNDSNNDDIISSS